MSGGASALMEDIRECGARLVPVLTAFEGVCLDVGRQLGDALPGLNGAAHALSEIAASLDGQPMQAATRDLELILSGLRGASATLEDESAAIHALDEVVREIGPQARDVQSFVRSVSILVFTLKIESSRLPSQTAEMIAFACNLQELAEKAREALENYVAVQVRLSDSLSASLIAHDAFASRYREAQATVTVEIAESLQAVASRRATASAGLQEIAGVTREIGERIGECVVGCQIGDTTRQRVEHISAALALAADAIRGEAASGDRLGARLVELQRLQTEDSHDEFSRETDTVAQSLVALTGRTLELEQRSRLVFGTDEGADGSFLQALGARLASARTLVSDGLSARRSVDDAKRAAAVAMAEMKASNVSLEEAAANVTIIGINASLRSSRLGDAGRGITLVAAELRGFGRLIGSGVNQLSETLGRALEGVDRFALADNELDANRMGELEQRMMQAVDVFGGGGRQILAAQERLAIEAAGAQEKLKRGQRALDQRSEAKRAFAEALGKLDQWDRCSQAAPAPDEEVDRRIADLLRPTYSMAQERRVHDRFAGLAEEAPEAETVEEADAFLL